jgi:hypothetical protein
METINIANLVVDIKKLDTWVVFVIVALFGMLGGFAHKLISPPEDKTTWPGYLVVGAVASLAVLFVFAPSDPVRLFALSLAAGYGGKTVLNALEAKVKIALAEAKTEQVKEDGKTAVDAGKEAISQAQKLSQINKELEQALIKAKGGPRQEIYEKLVAPLPVELQPFVAKSPDAVKGELQSLLGKLDSLEKSFIRK